MDVHMLASSQLHITSHYLLITLFTGPSKYSLYFSGSVMYSFLPVAYCVLCVLCSCASTTLDVYILEIEYLQALSLILFTTIEF